MTRRRATPLRKKLPPGRVTIVLEVTGSLSDAYNAARRVIDAGALQDAMHEHGLAVGGRAFAISDAKVQ